MTMRTMRRALALTLTALLALAAPALAGYGVEQVNNPAYYVGTWHGAGPNDGDMEYELEIFDYSDGHYTASLAIYRLWNFDEAHIWLDEMEPAGTFTTDGDSHVAGVVSFDKYGIGLYIVDSDSEYLPEGTTIAFR